MAENEREQILRAVAGDRDALTDLLARYGPGIETALRIDPTWQARLQPADIMQITYLEAFLHIGEFDPDRGTSFEGWLRRAAENNLRDAIRGLTRQKDPPMTRQVGAATPDDSLCGLAELLGVSQSTPSLKMGRREQAEAVRSAIAQLPDDYAQAIELYDLQGLAIEEVASRMGRSAGAIHMLRARGHERLRGMLGSGSTFFSSGA